MNFNKLKEPYVLILIGPPLFGKTTWIRKNFADKNVRLISRDQIVLDVYGVDNYDEAFKNVDQKKVNYVLESTLIESSENEENVIVDMTNLTSKRRKHTLSYFDDNYTKIAVIFPPVEWDEIQRRNEKRRNEENKNIPENVLKNMLASYQPVSHEEGFNKVVSL